MEVCSSNFFNQKNKEPLRALLFMKGVISI
nr:MAG TPA: hypothetical protein [Caudoviricetes sp.]